MSQIRTPNTAKEQSKEKIPETPTSESGANAKMVEGVTNCQQTKKHMK